MCAEYYSVLFNLYFDSHRHSLQFGYRLPSVGAYTTLYA